MKSAAASAVIVVGLLVLTSCQSGSARAHVSSSPSPGPPIAAPSIAPVGAPLVLDLSWIDDQSGWALVSVPCRSGSCPWLYATTDGAQHWSKRSELPGCLVCSLEDPTAVSHLRFANREDGYLFGAGLYATTDGGGSWRQQTAPLIEDLEPSAGLVYRLTYDHGGCPGPCQRTLQVAAAGSDAWRTLLTLPQGAGVRAEVIPMGGEIYVPMFGNPAGGGGFAHTTLHLSRDGGTTWTTLLDPCQSPNSAEIDAVALAAAPGGFIAAVCAPRGAPVGIVDFVATSADAGRTWIKRAKVPNPLDLIAAGSAQHIAVAGFSQLLASTDGGTEWSPTTFDTSGSAGGGDLDWLGFEDSAVGRWVVNGRAILTTADSGAHWTQVAAPA